MSYRINIVTYGTLLLGLPDALGALGALEPLGALLAQGIQGDRGALGALKAPCALGYLGGSQVSLEH